MKHNNLQNNLRHDWWTFLNHAFSNIQDFIEFRIISENGEIIDRKWLNTENEISEFVEQHNGKNHVFFGVSTREENGGKKVDCREVPWLWCDIDFKDFSGGESEARKTLDNFKYPPSIIVSTGGGLHCYWLLEEPVDAQTSKDQIEKALKHLCSSLNGDSSQTQIASILRVPGTVNVKEERNGAVCFIEEADWGRKYTLDQLIPKETEKEAMPNYIVSSKSIDDLSKEIKIGNRDFGAFKLVNAYIKEYCNRISDDEIENIVCGLLDQAGGDNLQAIKRKVPNWIQSGRKTFKNNNKLTPLELGGLVKEFYRKLIYFNQQFRVYTNGFWKEVHGDKIRQLITDLDRPNSKSSRTTEALATLKDELFAENLSPKSNLICLLNGTLNVDDGKLYPHSPENHLLQQLDFNWDPKAKSDLWLETLKDIFINDPDAKEKIEALQMWFGYCLIPETKYNKSLWLVGEGANGKSLICNIIIKLLGEQNVSNFMITSLEKSFYRSQLYGKLLNISTEVKADATLADGYFKAIVSGDYIQAERKFQDAFSFKSTARLMVATNHLPRILDLSHGFQRRIIILELNWIFTEQKQDKNREEKLIKELPGILVWAVRGLEKLRTNDGFVIPKSSTDALGNYIKESNPVQLFADEFLMDDDSGDIQTQDIYPYYKKWAIKNGFTVMNISNFGKKLKSLRYGKRKTGGKEVWKVSFNASISTLDDQESSYSGNGHSKLGWVDRPLGRGENATYTSRML